MTRAKKNNRQPYQQIIAGIPVIISKKTIKNCYLRIDSVTGQAKLSVPNGTKNAFIEQFVASKAQWIKQHQQRIANTAPLPSYQYRTGEQHYLWGRAYPLLVQENIGRQFVFLNDDKIVLNVRLNSQQSNRQKCLSQWYKGVMDAEISALLAKWQPVLNQSVSSWQVRQMKSRWGSCHIHRRHIVLNFSLVHKPKICLEYVLVHEMVHLYERYHNKRFYALMDQYLPHWREIKASLNSSEGNIP